jgi:spermidine synthase
MKTPINLSEEDGLRYLHFGSAWIQGAMRIRRPFDLVVDYTNDMMVWEGCVDAPAHIVQLGLGAGSLTKYCWKHYPNARITAVEISSQVIACAHAYFKLPALDDRLHIVCTDAAQWVRASANQEACDVLQVDLYDANARGPLFDTVAFYANCRRTLRRGGAMTVNVFGEDWGFEHSFANVFEAFEGACEALEPCAAGNRVILART